MNQKYPEFRAWLGNKMEYNVIAGKLGAFYAYIDPKDTASAITTKYNDDVPVMQYTGFKDMDDVKIFDKDILMYTKTVTIPGKNKTRIEKHYWEVYMSPKGQWVAKRGEVIQSLFKLLESNHEVVGNLYQYSKLVK